MGLEELCDFAWEDKLAWDDAVFGHVVGIRVYMTWCFSFFLFKNLPNGLFVVVRVVHRIRVAFTIGRFLMNEVIDSRKKYLAAAYVPVW